MKPRANRDFATHPGPASANAAPACHSLSGLGCATIHGVLRNRIGLENQHGRLPGSRRRRRRSTRRRGRPRSSRSPFSGPEMSARHPWAGKDRRSLPRLSARARSLSRTCIASAPAPSHRPSPCPAMVATSLEEPGPPRRLMVTKANPPAAWNVHVSRAIGVDAREKRRLSQDRRNPPRSRGSRQLVPSPRMDPGGSSSHPWHAGVDEGAGIEHLAHPGPSTVARASTRRTASRVIASL